MADNPKKKTPTTPAPVDPVTKALELRQKQAGTEEAEAKALTAKIAAQRSLYNTDSKIEGLKGMTTVTGVSVAAFTLIQRCAAKAARTVAQKAAEALKANQPGGPVTLLVYDKAVSDLIPVYTGTLKQMGLLEESFDGYLSAGRTRLSNARALIREATPKPADSAEALAVTNAMQALALDPITPLAVLGVVKSAAEIVSFFKTDTTITALEVSYTDKRFTLLFFDELRRQKVTGIADWVFFYPELNAPVPADDSPFLSQFTALAQKAEEARQLLQTMTTVAATIQALIDAGNNPRLPDLLSEVDDLSDIQAKLMALLTLFDGFVKQITDSTATGSLLSQVIRAEPVIQLLKQTNVFQIGIDLTTKADQRVRHRIWSNDRLEYTAAVWVGVSFFYPSGRLWQTFYATDQEPFTRTDLITGS